MTQPENSAQKKREARSERRRNQTRIEILDAAQVVVLREGFARLSLARVSDELALTKQALYYYFASKEAMMFELVLREWFETAQQIEAAVEMTTSGVDAIEALMRAAFERHRNRLDMYRLIFVPQLSGQFNNFTGPEELERIRPVNGMLYGGAEARLRADQKANVISSERHPRRLAFTAHMAIIGLLHMKAIVATADDPLIHSDKDLIDDICQTFRDAITTGRKS